MAPEKKKSSEGKEKVESTSEEEFDFLTYRIVFDDPDATESSSDERVRKTNDSKPLAPKRSMYEVVGLNPKIVEKLPLKKRWWKMFSTSLYKGVRLRRGKKKRYLAQIRNPFDKKTEHIGTYDTEYEAALAFRRKSKEFQKKKLADSSSSRSNDEKQEEEVAPPLGDFVLNQSCKEQEKGYDPSDDDDDDDDDNIGGGSSHQNIIDVRAV